jgi:hypothetical protein
MQLANGHGQHRQGQRPWWASRPNIDNTKPILAYGHDQTADEDEDYAAIVVATVRAFDFQHKGSVSILEE